MEKLLAARLHEALRDFRDMHSSLGHLTNLVERQIEALEESIKDLPVEEVAF
jgi:hypothetical protein